MTNLLREGASKDMKKGVIVINQILRFYNSRRTFQEIKHISFFIFVLVILCVSVCVLGYYIFSFSRFLLIFVPSFISLALETASLVDFPFRLVVCDGFLSSYEEDC